MTTTTSDGFVPSWGSSTSAAAASRTGTSRRTVRRPDEGWEPQRLVRRPRGRLRHRRAGRHRLRRPSGLPHQDASRVPRLRCRVGRDAADLRNTDSFVARAAGEQQFTFYGSVLRGPQRPAHGTHARRQPRGAGRSSAPRGLVRGTPDGGHGDGDQTARGRVAFHVRRRTARRGEGPTTWLAYVNQQMRWSFGCFDILRRVTWRRLPHLDWRARLYYVWLQQNYFQRAHLRGRCSAPGLLLPHRSRRGCHRPRAPAHLVRAVPGVAERPQLGDDAFQRPARRGTWSDAGRSRGGCLRPAGVLPRSPRRPQGKALVVQGDSEGRQGTVPRTPSPCSARRWAWRW